MTVFGLTGGIGMGKSAAERLLRDRGVPVVDTDALARQVVEPGRPALDEIQRAFGKEVIAPTGQLRREELARRVFSDPAARQALERITHPRIQQLWKVRIESWKTEKHPVAVVAIPLLFETGAESEMDATICVACSAATQRQRLLERGWSPEEITLRIAAQWSIEKKMAQSDYVIWSEGSLELLGEQLDRVVSPAASMD